MAIECLVLGAGQEVGKSCVVVSIGGKKIMFDCGMHMGSVDDPYPDFSRILGGSDRRDFDSELSCVVITHFHLDHVGALPYFTQVCGYNGPIYMTYPTKALSPLMLEDYRKVMVDRRGEQEKFTHEDILECMKKVTAVDIKQTIQVDKDLQIRAYYAGHVLGAAMFYAKVGESTLVYTGDYNMTPDRHLGAAQIDRLRLDLVITESTYATTIRDSKYAREREFLKVVHKCVSDGGKVLIPTFAMGRAQELCILLNDYWDRMNLKIPIYFSAGLTLQANMYYKMLIGWTSQKIKDSHTKHNAFDFKHVQPFTRSQIDAPGPCILFATPGMLTGGFSLEVFKHWAPSEKNLITLPGYCLAGTVGNKLMSGKASRIDLDKDTHVDVRCQIHQLSFSPHTDSKGIMDLVRYLSPKHVILVHGEKPNMEKLKVKIQSILGMPCYIPANNESVLVPTTQMVKIDAGKMFIEKASSSDFRTVYSGAGDWSNSDLKDIARSKLKCSRDVAVAEGILVMEKSKRPKVVYEDEIFQTLNVEEHKLQFCHCFHVGVNNLKAIPLQPGHEPDECVGNSLSSTSTDLKQFADDINSSFSSSSWLHLLQLKLKHLTGQKTIQVAEDHLVLDSAKISICQNENCPHLSKIAADALERSIYFSCSWSLGDEHLAHRILSIIEKLDDDMIHEEAGGEVVAAVN